MPTTMQEIVEDYICYDGPLPACPEIDNMSDSEVEFEFEKRFGKNIGK